MAYNVVTQGPSIMYVTPSAIWPSGKRYWTRTERSSVETRVKPKGAQLLLLPTPYTRVRQFNTQARYLYDDYSGYYNRNAAETTSTPPIFPNEDYQTGRNAVVIKLREKIKDVEWNLSNFLGELPKTYEYFGKTLATIATTYSAVRRGNVELVRQLRNAIREKRGPNHRSLAYAQYMRERWLRESNSGTNKLAARWMEWRYAISPLMYDFDDMLKSLYSQRSVPLYRRKVTGLKLRSNTSRDAYYLGNRVQTASISMSNQIRMGAIYRVNPNVDAFQKLGLLNPLATLWELTPLSFVVDWFIPVGDYLGSLDAMAGVSLVSTWESQRIKGTETRPAVVYTRAGSGWWVKEQVTASQAHVDSYYRSVGVDISASFPSFSMSLNAKRILDAAALTKRNLLK